MEILWMKFVETVVKDMGGTMEEQPHGHETTVQVTVVQIGKTAQELSLNQQEGIEKRINKAMSDAFAGIKAYIIVLIIIAGCIGAFVGIILQWIFSR